MVMNEEKMRQFVLGQEPNTDNPVVNDLILYARFLLKENTELHREIESIENWQENIGLEE